MLGKRFLFMALTVSLSVSSLVFADDDKDKVSETEEVTEVTIEDDGGVHRSIVIFRNGKNSGEPMILQNVGIPGQYAERLQGFRGAKASRYMMGIGCESISDLLRHHLKLDPNVGLAIQSVTEDSPAQKAGLQEHDIMTHLGDTPVTNIGEIGKILDKAEGAEMEVHYIRRGEKQTSKLTAIKRKPVDGVTWTFQSGEGGTEVDINAITDGIFSFSPGLRLKEGSQIQDALKQVLESRSQLSQRRTRSLEQLVKELNEKMKNLQKVDEKRVHRLEELQKKQTNQLEQRIDELRKLVEHSLSRTEQD